MTKDLEGFSNCIAHIIFYAIHDFFSVHDCYFHNSSPILLSLVVVIRRDVQLKLGSSSSPS
jgi:hypothetical protein